MVRARTSFSRSLALWITIPALVATTLTAGMTVLPVEAAIAATDPCAPPVSVVACENTLPGTPGSDWDVSGTGDASIQGYATAMSVTAGSTVRFKVKTPAASYRIDILRLGYYQGNGARKVAAGLLPSASLPQNQPACLTFPATGLIDCGNWAQSASWNVPSTAVSGVYIAHLIRNDTGGASLIPFVVRDDASTSEIVFQTSDTTWQAYNNYGGNSLYRCTVTCPPDFKNSAFAVSYNRPFTPTAQGPNWLMDAEVPMIRFMEANGYDVTYQAGLDTSTRGSLLLNHKVFMSTGHDEYWDASQRTNVEAARDAGVNLAFFSGNEIFWKTRWTASSDGTSTPGRTIVCYKDTHFNAPKDPVSWTGTWRDPRYGTAGGGGNPENSLTGQFFLVNRGSSDIKVPAEYAPMRLWRNTAAAALTGSQSLTLGSGLNTLGYEWDVDSDNGFRPAGSFRLSSTTVAATEVFNDYGSNVAPATVTHNLTMYRAPSGALVFGAGTIQWSYGLDNYTTGGTSDRNMQQATVNLFADMDAQPATLMAGLVAATKSTDATAPSSVITSGLNGQTLADGVKITIGGTASDAGGVVAGVEISTDGGATWHPATGKNTWTYSWIAHGSPTANVKTRAVDDSGNLETPGAGVTVEISCPCSIWGTNVIPDVVDSGDTGSLELGLKFSSDTAGTVTGVRFYKSTNNTGTHSGSLWTLAGQRLATATFTGETASGWQSVTFSTPVAITANTTYVVSYFAPQGHYSQATGYMHPHPSPIPAGRSSVDSAPLHALRNTPTSGNGLYAYSGSSAFPSNSFNAENYWVDVMYMNGAATTPSVASTTPAAGATGVAVSTAPSATFDQAVTPSSITFTLKDSGNNFVTGATSYNSATNRATFTPASALAYSTTYTATVSGATTAAGKTMTTPASWTFTTAATPTVPTVTSTSPAAEATGVAVGTAPTATFDQAVTSSSITFTLRDSGNNPVAGSSSYDSEGDTVKFTPTGALANSASYTATVSGATNSAGMTMAAPRTWTFTTAAVGACPCSVFSPSAVPATISENDPAAVELGMKFRSDVAGTVTGVRFYKGSQNTGTHTGRLWSSTGTVLASVTFTGETASGWQQAAFSTPVAISANTTYVVSYFAPNGRYSANGSYFIGASDNPPLHGLASGTDGPNGVYEYAATAGTFPTSSWNSTNYWVDVVFTAAPVPAPLVTSNAPVAGATGMAASTKPSATFDQAVTPASITFTLKDPDGSAVTGATSYNSTTNTVTFTPTGPLDYSTSYTATVSGATNATGQTLAAPRIWTFTTAAAPAAPTVTSTAPAAGATGVAASAAPWATFDQAVTPGSITFTLTDAAGAAVTGATSYSTDDNRVTFTPAAALTNSASYTATVSGATNSVGMTMVAPRTWTFTTAAAGACPCSVFSSSAIPATITENDPRAVELGMKFRSDVPGTVTGIRFYKGSQNTGTHTGHLWSSTGTRLASVTFTGETASGWQQATLSTPVAISANTTYIVSYYAPNGRYSANGSYFTSAANNPPLHGLANGTDGSNGVYTYGTELFPTSSYRSTNYWVDVVFSAAPLPAPSVTSNSPVAGATGVAVSTAPSATFDQAVTPSSITFTLKDAAETSVTGATSYSSITNTVTFTPAGNLAYATSYTASVGGATNATGQTIAAPRTWTFTTGAAPAAPAVTSNSPVAGATGVAATTAPSATFDQAVTLASITFTLKDAANTTVTGATSYSSITNTVTFTPAAALAYSTSYTASVSGATNTTGQSMTAPRTWTFTTGAEPAAPTITSNSPVAGATGVAVSTTPSATFDQAVTLASITFTVKDAANSAVTGTTSYSSITNRVTFTPAAALGNSTSYTATVSGATNSTGQTMAAPRTWTFTTAAAGACPCSVFSPGAVPVTITENDPRAVELGMKFRSDVAGTVTGVRFYKGSQNTGTHTGHLWSSTGTRLASVTFTDETASGWQQADFSTPVAISANTTYVVSYFAPDGRYSANGSYFTSAADNPPLHGLASGTDGSNGVYTYGTEQFPTSSYKDANYWVDVVFSAAPATVPVVTATAPESGATGVAVGTAPWATFDQAVTAASITFTLKDAAGNAVTGATSYNNATDRVTFTPASALGYSASYTATVSGATNAAGMTQAAARIWTFTTAAAGACPCSVFSPSAVPATISENDPRAVEVGMKFRSDIAGTITGIRFYKGPQNTGTHTGHLWSSTGTLLASVTFTGETASGWQQATLSAPVAINANATYVVSYFAPNGRYSATSNYFTTAANNLPLHGLANGADGPNGVYTYTTTTGAFPTSSYRSANYWVDVVFTTAP